LLGTISSARTLLYVTYAGRAVLNGERRVYVHPEPSLPLQREGGYFTLDLPVS